MKFDNCTRCNEPIMNRRCGGFALVNWYPKSKTVDNLCADCARREGEIQNARALEAIREAERSGA